jgi:RsiW-degrading membrane proteinase PrsW (M82 family)
MPHPYSLPSPRTSRIVATILVAIPVTMLTLLGFAEVLGGDRTGVQHFLTAAPLLALLVLGWQRPRIAGILLLALGLIVFLLWVVFVASVADRASPLVWLLVALALFTPPLVAGLLFLRSAD